MACIAGIELGGTTCVAAISTIKNPEVILEHGEFNTGNDPASTLDNLVEFLQQLLKKRVVESFKAMAIASFGPIDLRKESPKYGHITSTPKPGWQNVDVVGAFTQAFPNIPVMFETDVNAPAIGEAMVSSLPRLPNVVYITVGTGVGVGVYINGSPVHGLMHPEAGHLIAGVKPGDTYPGGCPFHKNCIEGMVNSNALAARAGVQPSELSTLPDSHWVWEIAGYYLGVLCVNLTYTLSPDVIILGGGVMQRNILFDICRENFKQLNAGYVLVEKFQTDEGLKEYIHGSKFGSNAGIIGALLLAKSAVNSAD
jgi:fructokinase